MKNFQNKTKIVKVSKIIRNILFAGLVLWIVAIPVSLAAFLIPIIELPKEKIHSSTTYEMCGMVLWQVLGLVVNLKLFKFFDRLKNGHLFDAQTVGNLGAAGKWWIALWLYEGLFFVIRNQIFQMKMVWNSGGLFAGLTLIFVAWLLKEAQELQEEQELTV
jgi:Protein of unknown function (DUF2975)